MKTAMEIFITSVDTMDNFTKRLVICFSEKLDQAKNGYIEWDSFKHMALRATFQQCGGQHREDIYQKYLEQSKLWWDSLTRDVSADEQGRVHYIDMANFVRNITKQTKTFEELPEFIRNLANLVFMMNDSKADGKWDMEEYRNGSVAWCPGVTDVSVVDAAFESLLTPSDADRCISFDRYKALVVEFFTSSDGNTNARHIFGPLELSNFDQVFTSNSKQ